MENLGTSLWITLIGMGLVFVAIILLWGLMYFLVSLLKEKESTDETPIPTASAGQDAEVKAKVAAVAVSIALNTATLSQYQGEHPAPVSGVSSWQSSFRQTPS